MASNVSQFVGGDGPVTAIVNYYSAGGVNSGQDLSNGIASNTRETLSGALTAATLLTLHNLTGRGRLNELTLYTKDATARTVRLQLTIDGLVVFDATSSSIATPGYGIVALGGGIVSAQGLMAFQPVLWNTSCVIKVASSLTETNKIATGINYEVWG